MSSRPQHPPSVAAKPMPHPPWREPRPSTVIEDITNKELQLIRLMKDHAEQCRIMRNRQATQNHTTAQCEHNERGRQDRSRSPVSGSSSLPDPSSLCNLQMPEPFSDSPASEDWILSQGLKSSRVMWLNYHIGCCEIMSAYMSVVHLKDPSSCKIYHNNHHSYVAAVLVDVEAFRLELQEVVVNDPVQDLRRFRQRYEALFLRFMRIRSYCHELIEHNL